jgi:UDP:flavonoid glycosyltransferase YjiC (YdhE family)
MNRIIFLIEPVEGHVNPCLPIISECTKQEYEVVCITGSKFKAQVEKTGATFQNLPEKWDPGEKDPYEIFPELKKLSGISQIKYYLKHILYDQIPDTLDTLEKVTDRIPCRCSD